MLRLSVSTNIKRVRKDFKDHPVRFRAAVVRGLGRSGQHVEREAKLNLTKNRSVAFGVLRASVGHKVDPKTLTVVVGPALANKATASATGDPRNYGLFVELGRRPGKRPPIRALKLWVKRRIGAEEGADLDRLTFLIARKIGADGTQAKPFLGPAVRGAEPRIAKILETELDREIAAINSER